MKIYDDHITEVSTESNREISKPAEKGKRLLSLDALRGFDMFWIISGEGIFHGLADRVLKANPSNNLSFWERLVVGISNQLHHTTWNGFTFYDLIFPLFIFIAGVSMPYSSGNKNIYSSLLQRTIILILLGIVVNGALQSPITGETSPQSLRS